MTITLEAQVVAKRGHGMREVASGQTARSMPTLLRILPAILSARPSLATEPMAERPTASAMPNWGERSISPLGRFASAA